MVVVMTRMRMMVVVMTRMRMMMVVVVMTRMRMMVVVMTRMRMMMMVVVIFLHHYSSTQCCNTETVFINIPLPPDQHYMAKWR